MSSNGKPSVTIGVPSTGSLRSLTTFSLISSVMALHTNGHDIHLTSVIGPYTHWNRDQIIKDAENAGTDFVMMIDSDMAFPPHGILQLLSRDKDVISGFYLMKMTPPQHPFKFGEFDEMTCEFSESDPNYVPPPEPFQVTAAPTGFLLIRMAAIAELPRPLFPAVEPIGEDIAFCLAARARGLEIWCDPTFKLDHIGDYKY